MASVTAITITKNGDRSFSAKFTSAATTDVLSFADIAAALPGTNSSIEQFIASSPTLATIASRGVSCSLVSSVTGSCVQYDAAGFKGFAAGDHALRVSLSASATA